MQIEIVKDLMPDCKTMFDGFLGSGTALLVAYYLKNNIYATEIMPYYIQLSLIRLINFFDKNEIKYTFQHKNGDIKLEDIKK